jgi:metallo-beta-lactamase class B
VTAAHTDHYAGARLLVDRYHPRVLMSEADWNVLAKSNVPNAIKPKKDMVITDGQKLTLGDTTITFYLTPGHTPGMVSMLIPLKDGTQRHLGGLWGGLGFGDARDGVTYFPTRAEMLKTYAASARRFWDIESKAGVDVLITNHTRLDKGLEKMAALKNRKANDPHSFVGADAVKRFMTVLNECAEAQLVWMAKPSN